MSDTERMLEDLLIEEFEADFGATGASQADLPVVQRSKFRYALDAFRGEDIRRGLQANSPETHAEWQVSALDEEQYNQLCIRNLEAMCAFLKGLLDESRVGPLLAVKGNGVLQTSTNKAGEYRAFPLLPSQVAFGSLQKVSFGGYHSLGQSNEASVKTAEEIKKLPKVFGGMACLETVDICSEDGQPVRTYADMYVPLHEPDLNIAAAYPAE